MRQKSLCLGVAFAACLGASAVGAEESGSSAADSSAAAAGAAGDSPAAQVQPTPGVATTDSIPRARMRVRHTQVAVLRSGPGLEHALVTTVLEDDIVIVDAPATGAGVGFLQTPRTFANIARVGPIKAQAEALEALLVNHRKTGAAIVALPEEMPVNETVALERQLSEEVDVAVDRVYMNALYPERFSKHDLERLENASAKANGPLRAAYRAALSESRRAAAQREQLARLAELVKAPVRTLPFVFKPDLGVEEIRELASGVG